MTEKRPISNKRKTARKAGLVLLVILLVGILAAIAFPTLARVSAKMLFGEGGVIKFVGMSRASLGDESVEYDTYFGKARYGSGRISAELVLIARNPLPTTELESDFGKLLVGKNRILFPNGLEFERLPFGFLPMTCLGGIAATMGKAGAYSLEVRDVGQERQYRLRSDDPRSPLVFDLFVPLSLTQLLPSSSP